MNRFQATLVVALLGSTGCITHTEFVPRSAVASPQVTEKAVQIYERDAAYLEAAGGDVIGVVRSRGSAVTDFGTLSSRAADEAAENGGTHIILTDRGLSQVLVTTGQAHVQTNCVAAGNGVNCDSTYTPATTRAYAKPHARYVVIRVPPERWGELPVGIRPVAKR